MSDQLVMKERQLRELHSTVRHLGRALAALNRASIPSSPRIGVCPEWLCSLYDAEHAVAEASNRLIDALEAMPNGY